MFLEECKYINKVKKTYADLSNDNLEISPDEKVSNKEDSDQISCQMFLNIAG